MTRSELWQQQRDKWNAIATDWQGLHEIIDRELEQELQRLAGVIAWIFHNMSQGYAQRFTLLDKLKKLYQSTKNTYQFVIESYIENGWLCEPCWTKTYYPETDETVICCCEEMPNV